MKFKALPVNVGDSFYLKTEKYNILVDGGMNKKHIVQLLKKEKIPNNHFDVLICTHYDADHINGILGILNSNQFSFKELWLPEIFGSIGYNISKNLLPVLEELKNINLKTLNKIFTQEQFYETNLQDIENSYEKIDFQALAQIKDLFDKQPFYSLYFSDNLSIAHFTNLYKIIDCLILSYSSGSHIRWFKYKKSLINKLINFNLYAQNCTQTSITLYSPKKVLYLLHLSTINKNSLVFKYHEKHKPEILFTGDSDLSFCGTSTIQLQDESIVTAPHHGSSSNNPAYSKIIGNNLVFVRSDRSQIKRPGKGYLSQKMKYCTICRNKTPKQSIELTLKSKSFYTKAKQCKC